MAVKGKEELEEGEEAIKPAPKNSPSCIVCGANADFCMRGIPKNTYCRECAEDYFGLLEHLDKL